ncbi:E3 ubiquitin-protein ligase TRIM21-like isoform X2 [Nematolebias whitei]|uniref:E3 ubiquitin-protein ligase TRIM21-like isoform X2 n=1 Tax=Nematolebias whitei TaxID=451745 RepID=UPI00189C1712|nr:E3 ubiquitin-protein ligase TRIM21-like isoform X2 [Nematolebias whitei]
MSAGSNLRSEDQFLCSICLGLFTDPVSTPCGHNFCKICISKHWDWTNSCQCPVCNKVLETRPLMEVNTFIKEMVAQFRHEAQQKTNSSSEQQAAEPGEVPCDVCTGPILKALKSCLVCLASYCQTHLEPHLTASRLKRHQLVDPVENLEDRMCLKHDKPLELFCKTDQTCVCSLCSVLDHKTHELVPLREEYEGKKAELRNTEAEVQQMIQKRQLKIQELRESMKTSKDAEDFIKHLEHEIFELMKRSSEVKQLSLSEDHLHLLQSFRSLKAAPPTKNWTEVRVHPPSYEGTVVRAVAQLEQNLREKIKKKLSEAELKRVQKSEVDLTLDPKTANSYLILSDDGKQVHCGDVKKNLPDNPERFSYAGCVLGTQSFSSGRFYFEVQVKEKTDWTLGVAREFINRKRDVSLSPNDGLWTVWLRNRNEYKALADPSVRLNLQPGPEKVGVFVDYEEGLVSFYDVDSAALIYSFTGCCFSQKLYPFFNPCPNIGGKNSAPLIICPVNQST